MSKSIADFATKESQRTSVAVRLDAWRAVFEKTDRIMSGKPLDVRIAHDGDIPGGMDEVPGWSDGSTITFNGPMVLDLLRTKDPLNAVLRLKGLNYHELAHVLFTPRQSDELPKRVIERQNADNDRTWWYAMNALEDQRIETWFTAMYGPSRRYFEAAVLQWLMENGNAEAAILIHGRKYLAPKIRVGAERAFVAKYGRDLYAEFVDIIDQYLTMTFPHDSVKAFMLVSKYKDLLKHMQQQGGNRHLPVLVVEDNGVAQNRRGGNTTPGHEARVKSGRLSRKEQDAARDAAEDMAEAAAEADERHKADMQAEAEAKAEAQSEQGEQPGEGTAAGQAGEHVGDDTDAEGIAPGDGGDAEADSESAEGGAGSSGTHDSIDVLDDITLEDAIRDLMDSAAEGMDDIRDDEAVKADADRVLDAVKASHNDGKIDADGERAKVRGKTSPTPEYLAAQRRIRSLLQQIRQEVEPQILRRQDAGRLDVRRLIAARPNERDVFTSYDEGSEEETGIEAVVLIDFSGSMQTEMPAACAAAWTLKRAFDSLSIRTTVMLFDTDHYILYQPSKKADAMVPVIASAGGTDPESALREALKIFSKSVAPNKVLVTVTDGQWASNDREIGGLLKAMHSIGTTSLLLGLSSAFKHYGKHGHTLGHDLNSVSDLPKAVTKLVGEIMRVSSGQV